MAYFCPSSGIRIVAPGVCKDAGGNVPAFTGSPQDQAAEAAAASALAAEPVRTESSLQNARAAAFKVLGIPVEEPPAKPPAEAPVGAAAPAKAPTAVKPPPK